MKGIVIAGTKSGSGKTTITLGLLEAFIRRSLTVAPFKIGPDFIDPGYHTHITGIPSRNLDGWMLSKNYNLDIFARSTQRADIAVVEGVMGLFDGYEGTSEAGSTAQMAKWIDLPVILIVDAKSMARSAAALVQGFQNFDPDLDFAGVIFNNVGSSRHLQYLKDALKENVNVSCLGGIFKNTDVTIPERHLGLVTKEDNPLSKHQKGNLADMIEKNINLDDLLINMRNSECPSTVEPMRLVSSNQNRVNIGVARDNAFSFYYQDNLDILESYGANICPFSPVNDEALPQNIDGLYFGGGYPELYAEQLEDNVNLKSEVKNYSQMGMPIYGECGGFMYLCKDLFNPEQNKYSMTGCFSFTTQMLPKLRSLGYRKVIVNKDSLLGQSGQEIRGHEFHYSKIVENRTDLEKVYTLKARSSYQEEREGYYKNRTLGSYVHLHFGSNPEAAKSFVNHCRIFRKERNEQL